MLLLAPVVGMSQQTAKLTQYLFNKYALNPATGGLYGCMEINLLHRMQWMGLDGAPRTSMLTIHREYGKDQNFKNSWIGVGVKIERDAVGPFDVIGVSPSFSYHLKTSKDYTLSFGLFGGIKQHTFKPVDNGLPAADPVFAGNSVSLIWPQFTPGIWYNSERKWFAGLTVDQVWRSKMGSIGSPSKLRPHFYLIAGRKFIRKGELNAFEPSMMIQYTALWPPSIDWNLKWYYKEAFGVGVGLRTRDGFVAMIEYQLSKKLRLGYSYDYTTSKVRLSSNNTHEFTLRWVHCVKNEVQPIYYCPAYK